MNKQELIEAIVKSTGQTKGSVTEVLDAVTEAIKAAVASDDTVQLVGFGSFSRGERAAREGRNPKTGESLQIAAAYTAKFTAGKAFKDAVNAK